MAVIEETAKNICRKYQYQEIRTPIFEHTELFLRGVGDTTDIVQKEMYSFDDRGDRSLTLRPEGTAPVVRSFAENKMHGNANQPVKFIILDRCFDMRDRKQADSDSLSNLGLKHLAVWILLLMLKSSHLRWTYIGNSD